MPLILVPTIEGAAVAPSPQIVTQSIQEAPARSTSVAATYPTRQSGDLMTVFVATYGNVTAPSGWTLQLSGIPTNNGTVYVYVYTRVTDNAEGTQTWTFSASDLHTFYTVVTRGVVWNKGVYNGDQNATSKTIPIPAITPGAANSIYIGMVHAYGFGSTGSMTFPSPLTKIAERFSTQNDGNNLYNHGALASLSPANVQQYGPYNVTSTDDNYWAGVAVALSPAA